MKGNMHLLEQFYDAYEEYYDVGNRYERPFDYVTLMYIEVPIIAVTSFIAAFGVISNLLSLIVFFRQGILSHSSIVTLSAISVTDTCSCFLSFLVLLPTLFRYFVDVSQWKWDVDYFEVYVTIRPTHMFTQITCLATAYLTFERVISVVFPFKAKSIFTPKRSAIAMLFLFLIVFVIHIPNNYQAVPSWTKNPVPNQTVYPLTALISNELHSAYFILSPITLRFVSVAVVIVCNSILFWKVNLSHKFRQKSGHTTTTTTTTSKTINTNTNSTTNNSNKGDNYHKSETSNNSTNATTTTSSKEMYLLRMITTISSVFTVCYMVNIITTTFMTLVYKSWRDYHAYLNFIAWDVVSLFQTVNGSINIFIYYNMSKRFKEELRLCFHIAEKTQ